MVSMQINNRLQPSTMPLMSLAATAIDQVLTLFAYHLSLFAWIHVMFLPASQGSLQ